MNANERQPTPQTPCSQQGNPTDAELDGGDDPGFGLDGVDAERTRAAFVYKAYDADGELLYVGISGTLNRFHAHSLMSPWWSMVARLDIEHFKTRPEAAERERALIRDLQPPWNTVHVGQRAVSVPYGYLSVEGVARFLGMSGGYVIAHAEELGAREVVIDGRDNLIFNAKALARKIERDGERETAARRSAAPERKDPPPG